MGNQASRQSGSPLDEERAKLEALFQSSGELVHLQSLFGLLSEGHSSDGQSGAAGGAGSSRAAMHADLKAIFNLPVSDDSPATMRAALRIFNAHFETEIFGKAPEGVSYSSFLAGVARCGRLGSKKEQVELLMRSFGGSAGEGESAQERVQSGGIASTPAPSQTDDTSNSKGPREQIEGILLASWYLTAWIRGQSSSQTASEPNKGSLAGSAKKGENESPAIQWPDLRALVEGAIESTAASSGQEKVSSKSALPVDELVSWAVATVPGLTDVLEPFILKKCRTFLDEKADHSKTKQGTQPVSGEGSQSDDGPSQEGGDSGLHRESEEEEGAAWKPGMLTPGVAWSMGLALSSGTAKWGVGPRLIDLGCGGGDLTRLVGHPRLLYRSSENGRGMNRFMSHVEGYSGTVLVIIAARPFSGGESWTVSALLPDGLANNRSFFGSSSSCLFSLKPTFKVFRATGRESNFVYCHSKVAGQGYQTTPLPEGLGLGGALGKERLWLDDNATPGKVTVRHHAVDKTFQPGALVPDLGYGGVEARVEDVEVWGLGGPQADAKQRAYLEREQRFQEQRRKVDMKKFAEGWQDSPDRLILEWGGART